MLQRFINAQADIYETALKEIQSGHKRTHWMWFIFPQLKGLGRSPTSMYYGLDGIEETREYLNNPILGARLREITKALLMLHDTNPHSIFGSPDDMKLRSCMTLFDAIEPNSIFRQVIDTFFQGRQDTRTLSILARNNSTKTI